MGNSMTTIGELVDREKRHLNYLRISITDRCNLRCLYCAPEGRIPKLDHGEILSFEEILRLVKIGIRLGIRKVRITGGEPLVRKGAIDLLGRLTRIGELKDVSLTTNGVLLAANAQRIFDAGIRRINVSLDSLDREKYAQITGYHQFDRVWEGIRRAREIGFSPIKSMSWPCGASTMTKSSILPGFHWTIRSTSDLSNTCPSETAGPVPGIRFWHRKSRKKLPPSASWFR
jgi:uncharacterized radical SAM superfamily Fe-S cluster-containing enzyme